VVDNASRDRSAEMVSAEFPDVRVIRNDDNVGFARACNQGMRASHGRFILLLNSDTYVVDDVVERTRGYLASRPEIAMAGCQLRYPDGRVQHTAFRRLGIFQSLFEDLWLYKLVPASARKHLLLGGYWECDEEMEVDWLAGAFMMLRREAFEQSGGFCEGFFMYGEDSEWCLRLRKMGKRIFFNPLGIVYHVGNVSSDLEWTERERLRRCHLGGIGAYTRLHGPVLGYFYRLTRLAGSAVRWMVYAVLSAVRPREYYRTQVGVYGRLAGFYLEAVVHPSVGAAPAKSD
jgi:GT2 family glycosyltransferase